jgi:hypothetical protein
MLKIQKVKTTIVKPENSYIKHLILLNLNLTHLFKNYEIY